jgi:P27 family predicted phage terminase small subunit
MKNSNRPKAPAHLSAAAKKWWVALTDIYEFESPDSVMTLECVMECLDRATTARQMVEKEGAVVKDRFGQLKAHPATVIERDAKMAMLRALRALGLDIIQPGSLPIGRPAAGR